MHAAWIVVGVLALVIAALGGLLLRARRSGPLPEPPPGAGRILFPFVAHGLSPRALDAALRLARAENAVLVPVFLARVPLHLPLEAPLPRQSAICISLQEAIEQRATTFGVPVDSRIERGRSYRHALRQTIVHERFDRMVVAAGGAGSGVDTDDVGWLLENAPGEIVVLRPDPTRAVPVPDQAPNGRRRRASATASRGQRTARGTGQPTPAG